MNFGLDDIDSFDDLQDSIDDLEDATKSVVDGSKGSSRWIKKSWQTELEH